MEVKTLDGILFAKMIRYGAANLQAHAKEINDLNVFPIPDGDTGDNMLMTVMGGIQHDADCEKLCDVTERVANGMLMAARGNSGVILSQFFAGINNGFQGLHCADTKEMGEAFRQGVRQAYNAVMTPTEGTVLTVVREATEYACEQNTETPQEFLNVFIEEAKRSLQRTPALLPILKKAGVVDSGAAGFIEIADGMMKAARGATFTEVPEFSEFSETVPLLDFDAFDENSVLEFGYCTELLVRLQSAKTDISSFDINMITAYLQTVGDSVAAVQSGSIVKLHVHTATPQKVLDFCQQFGEFLKVKIENMSLQHNSTMAEKKENALSAKRKKYAVVAVASGEGLKEAFKERGADVVVDGGQSMNPSAESLMAAFDEANADTVFVFPNNANIILTAQQAAHLYENADVRVIESTTVGAGYASLAMLDTASKNTDDIAEELTAAMDGVITAEISHCVRHAVIDGKEMHTGDYIGFVGKNILAVNRDRLDTVCQTVEKLDLANYDICIVFFGKDVTDEEAEKVKAYINAHYRGKEVYIINGGQDVYDYILTVE